MVLENRAQHAALLGFGHGRFARNRVLGELTLRANEIARHVAERVDDARAARRSRDHQRPARSLQARRNLAGRRGARRVRPRAVQLAATGIQRRQHARAAPSTPVRANVQTHARHRDSADRRRSRGRSPLARGLARLGRGAHAVRCDASSVQLRKALLVAGALGRGCAAGRFRASPGGPAAACTSPSPR